MWRQFLCLPIIGLYSFDLALKAVVGARSQLSSLSCSLRFMVNKMSVSVSVRLPFVLAPTHFIISSFCRRADMAELAPFWATLRSWQCNDSKDTLRSKDFPTEHIHEEVWRECFNGSDYDLIWDNLLVLTRLHYPTCSYDWLTSRTLTPQVVSLPHSWWLVKVHSFIIR